MQRCRTVESVGTWADKAIVHGIAPGVDCARWASQWPQGSRASGVPGLSQRGAAHPECFPAPEAVTCVEASESPPSSGRRVGSISFPLSESR